MEGRTLSPLLIFPEGTVTSGKHLLKFQKGAFANLLPIKPLIVKCLDTNFDLTTGSSSQTLHFVRTLCYFYHNYEITELPVIRPTEYMFRGNGEKWEIYAETVRSIYSEVGNFEKTDMDFKNNHEYYNLIIGKKKE